MGQALQQLCLDTDEVRNGYSKIHIQPNKNNRNNITNNIKEMHILLISGFTRDLESQLFAQIEDDDIFELLSQFCEHIIPNFTNKIAIRTVQQKRDVFFEIKPDSTSYSYNDCIHILGVCDVELDAIDQNKCVSYDLKSSKFSYLSDLPRELTNITALQVSSHLTDNNSDDDDDDHIHDKFVIVGNDMNYNSNDSNNAIWIYYEKTGLWTMISKPSHYGRGSRASFDKSGQNLHIIDANSDTKTHLKYDFVSKRWKELNSEFPEYVHSGAFALYDECLYYFGGRYDEFYEDVHRYSNGMFIFNENNHNKWVKSSVKMPVAMHSFPYCNTGTQFVILDNDLKSMFVFDFKSQKWVTHCGIEMPSELDNITLAYLNKEIHGFGTSSNFDEQSNKVTCGVCHFVINPK